MKFELTKSQALVLTGPQGSGKTTLARDIAGRCGTFAEISVDDLIGHFGLGRALAAEPDTLIVEKMPRALLGKIKAFLGKDTIQCNQKYKAPRQVKRPNFILCINESDLPHWIASDPCFRVVRMGETTHPILAD